MGWDEMLETLGPWCRSGAPALWPAVVVPVEAEVLWTRLEAWAPPGVVPDRGDPLPGSTREWRDDPGTPIPMTDPVARVMLERAGPYSDGSRLDTLGAVFRFGSTDSLRIDVQNGRDRLFRTVYMMRFAETGYEGHAFVDVEASADEFVDLLWTSFAAPVRERILAGPAE